MSGGALQIPFERNNVPFFVKEGYYTFLNGTHHSVEEKVDGDVRKIYCGR